MKKKKKKNRFITFTVLIKSNFYITSRPNLQKLIFRKKKITKVKSPIPAHKT